MNTKQYCFYFSSVNFALCVYSVYIMLYLSESGFTAFDIGLFTAMSGVVGIAAQLLWGAIADRVSVPKLLVIIMVLIIGLSLTINVVPDSWRIYFILGVVFMQAPITLLSETWALSGNQALSKSFGVIRGLGSLGWGLSSLVSGYLIGWLGFEMMFPLYAVLFIIPMAVMIIVKKLLAKRSTSPLASIDPTHVTAKTVSAPKIEHASASTGTRKLIGTPFVAAVIFLTFAGLSQSIFGFMPLFIQELGGGSGFLGLYTLVMTLSEMPLFFYSERIFSRYSLRSIMLFMLIAYALRFTLHLVSYTLTVVLVLSVLQALTYPLLFIVGKRLIVQTISKDNLNTAFGVLASVQSLLGIGFFVLCGWVMEVYHVRSLFVVGLIICFVSYWIFHFLISNRIGKQLVQTT